MSNTLCQCGCDRMGPRHRMKRVRARWMAGNRQRFGREIMVLPQCEEGFTQEYVQTQRLADFIKRNAGRNLLVRTWFSLVVFLRLLEIHGRTKRNAWSLAAAGTWNWLRGK